MEAAAGYWATPPGILQRIDALAQDLYFKTVNNAFKMVAPTNGAKYLYWRIADNDRVCWKCMEYATGGDGGYYKVSWFMPHIPVHPNCRCQLELVFGEP
jgi:hypothetical protein